MMYHTWIARVQQWARTLKGASVALWCALVLLALLPWIWMPWFAEPLMAPKRLLLVVCMGIAALALAQERYRTRMGYTGLRSPFALGWLCVGAVTVAALGSVAPSTSWFGLGHQGITAVLPLLACFALMHVGARMARDARALRLATGVLAASTGLGALLGCVMLFVPGVALLPYGFTPAGVHQALALQEAIVALWLVGVWVMQDRRKTDTWMPTRGWRFLFVGLGAGHLAALFMLLLFGVQTPATLCVLVGSAVFLVLALFSPKTIPHPGRLSVPFLLLCFTLGLLLFGPLTTRLPNEYRLGSTMSWGLVTTSLKADGLFGSGPNTYALTYSQVRPADVLQAPYGSLLFDRGSSVWTTLLVTWGLLPCLFLLGWMLLIAWLSVRALFLRQGHEHQQQGIVLFVGWLVSAVSFFCYPPETVVWVLYWLLSGLLVGTVMAPMATGSWKPQSRQALVASLGLIGSGLFFLMALAYGLQTQTAEFALGRAARLKGVDGSAQRVAELTARATRVNRWRADYARANAVAQLRAIKEQVQAYPEGPTDAMREQLNAALSSAQRAIALEVTSAESWHVLGQLYGAVATSVPGALDRSVEAYRHASQLDPVSVTRRLTLVQALLLKADEVRAAVKEPAQVREAANTTLEEAKEQTQQIIALAPQRAEGYYLRALVLERSGDLPSAIGQLEQLVLASPNDAVLRFELGVLQLRAGDKRKAKASFSAAAQLAPTYANAKWYLSSLLEEEGDLERAVRLLDDLLILNPDDQLVRDKRTLLEQGRVPAADTESLAPLPEPTP